MIAWQCCVLISLGPIGLAILALHSRAYWMRQAAKERRWRHEDVAELTTDLEVAWAKADVARDERDAMRAAIVAWCQASDAATVRPLNFAAWCELIDAAEKGLRKAVGR